jgi:3-isopropylmalate/(R)-2-methylmalate dehydratase small subunit
MTPFTTIIGHAAVLERANIDTDQIIPARFLRKPRGEGYNGFLFHDARAADPCFPLRSADNPPILIAGANFGCGSSREGAVYALVDAGVRCVIATSFGDIFAGNAGKNGMLTIVLPPDEHAAVLRAARQTSRFTVDLAEQTICFGNHALGFKVDTYLKRCLRDGLDDISLTLDETASIAAFEAADGKRRPWSVPD